MTTRVTPELRSKQSEQMKGNTCNLGHKASEETKRKMSASHRAARAGKDVI